VYIQCIKHIITMGKQALILLPEIGLTPQFIERFERQLNVDIAVLHSALQDRERLHAWLRARDGRALVVLGTRSAIWTPFQQLGIIIVDEEHDLSYKQKDGFRYSARDLAMIRSQQENIPVVLGSATPSMESLQNAVKGRYKELKLGRRAGGARLPRINILDIRASKMHGAVSQTLLESIQYCIEKNQQALLFLNRRGYAPVIMCHDCGWVFKCSRCNIQMTYHKHNNKLCCHHCGHVEKLINNCHECNSHKIIEIGHGTQRLAETLEKILPSAHLIRIDRDSTRRKGAMQSMLNDIHSGGVDILIGTQMLAKGHHFPRVTLVGIIDADRGLYSADYRASERMAQLILQVSGRAGRAENPGTVIIQTHHPEHPLLTTLIEHGYAKFAELVLRERKEALLPPFSYHALLRAEAHDMQLSRKFLTDAKSRLPATNKLQMEIFGPIASPIEKRAGRYRMQLLLQSTDRSRLRQILEPWVKILEQIPSARKVRWSLDVDPQDML
ncbi:MAG: primosomal protein N', partial [Gammaproteobacteria bacterium]|nr:primosomal protein N' [Gammaproteobacteria bacterium]